MDVKMSEARVSNLRLVVAYVVAGGDPANDADLADIDGEHHAESSNTDVASVLAQDDTTRRHVVDYELHPVLGNAVLSGFADADLGDGERMVSWGPFDLNIVSDEAETAHVSIGELIPKP